jgi:hypothetical protein
VSVLPQGGGGGGLFKAKAMNEVDAGRDRATLASGTQCDVTRRVNLVMSQTKTYIQVRDKDFVR